MSPTSTRLPRLRRLSALTLLAAASIAQAQSPANRPTRSDPLDPQARVPAASYQSPLNSYRRLGDDKSVPWKEANETVNRIGGWRAYAREAQQPEPAASAPAGRSAPVPTPAPAPATAPATAPAHGGHKKP